MWKEQKAYPELNQFYQTANKWEAALDVASTKDRPSLPATYFKFAKHLEEIGDIPGSIAAYEKSNASK